MFDKKGLVNEAHKPALKNALYNQPGLSECILPDFPEDTHNVIDGGPMLRRVPWVVGSTYDEICETYKHYLLSNYRTADNITVVFDGGYLLPSTKATTVAQWLRASIFRQICMSTFEWRGFESRWCLSVGI